MSLFGALNTAISGLSSQSANFSNISDNIANSQTVGYKQVTTSFSDFLTVSNATVNESGSVVATPQYSNDVQGTIQQSTNPLAIAITGQGFFPVSIQNGIASGNPTFAAQPEYTRAGDFTMNSNGYLGEQRRAISERLAGRRHHRRRRSDRSEPGPSQPDGI